MQRLGFLHGFLAALALLGCGWGAFEHWYLSPRALAGHEAACMERVKLAGQGYVVPIPVDVPPAAPVHREPARRVQVTPKASPPAPPTEPAEPALPPSAGGATSPDDAAPGGGLGYGETSPFRCRAVPGTGDVICGDPPGCADDATCDVDVRAGMVRARATCGGADVPCRVTGGLPVPTFAPPTLTFPPRWAAELRAGYGSDGWAAGASVYGRSRFGGWIQAGDRRGEGGVAFRLGPR